MLEIKNLLLFILKFGIQYFGPFRTTQFPIFSSFSQSLGLVTLIMDAAMITPSRRETVGQKSIRLVKENPLITFGTCAWSLHEARKEFGLKCV